MLEAGFRAGVTTPARRQPGGSGLGELRRTMIAWQDTDVDFEAKLSGALDRPSWLATQVHARRTHG